MNDSIKMDNGVITSKDARSIRLCNKFYTIRNPWTVTLCRALGKLEPIRLPGEVTTLDAIMTIPEYSPKVAAFIAVMCVGNVKRWGVIERIRYFRAFRLAMRTTESEKKEAFAACLTLVGVCDFLDYASWGVMLVGQMAKAKQE